MDKVIWQKAIDNARLMIDVTSGTCAYQRIYRRRFGRHLPSSVSDAQINRGWITLGQSFGRNGFIGVQPILKRFARDLESYAKEIMSVSFAVWSQCTNMTDRQTNRQTTER